jgi:hypothetical protein
LVGAALAILSERRVYALQQLLLNERFSQKIQGPPLDGANAGSYVAVTCDEDDRWMILIAHLLLQVQALTVWELGVQDQASGYISLGVSKEFGCGAERDGTQVRGREELLERLANAIIVIYDYYDVVSREH